MKTVFYKMGTQRDEEILVSAGAVIRSGGLVGFPTETVYGLGCNALDGQSALKVFQAKGRPADNPLIVHVATPEEAEKLAYTTPVYYRLAKRFMPGPLTVIMPKKECIPAEITAGNDTVAIRCPSNPVAHALIAEAGVPIAAPSANRSGSPSPTTAQHVLEDMDGRIEMILDGGACSIGLESTVVKLNGEECVILRPGAVTKAMLEEVCDAVEVADGAIDPSLVTGNVPSPGMKYKHYSPVAEVILLGTDRENFIAYVNQHATAGDAILCFTEDAEKFREDLLVLPLGHVTSPSEQAQTLYAHLREADAVSAKHVYVMKPDIKDEFLAMYNRLIRAASCKIKEI